MRMNREQTALYYLRKYADAIRSGERIGIAACNAHFAMKMLLKG